MQYARLLASALAITGFQQLYLNFRYTRVSQPVDHGIILDRPRPCIIEIEYVLQDRPSIETWAASEPTGLVFALICSVRCVIKCFPVVFISALFIGYSCRIGEFVQSVGHGPSIYLLIGPYT